MHLLHSLWICGDGRAELFSPESYPKMGEPLWAWDSATAPGIPENRRAWFKALDEVKPSAISREDCVLVTSSSEGGVALIRLEDHKLLFSAQVKNAHSAEMLPGGWIAVAGSIGTDKLLLYHVEDGAEALAPRTETPLPHGHGVVYDARRGLLWASGADHIVAFRWETSRAGKGWERAFEIELPENHAHDMLPDPHRGGLIITTASRVWRLDPQSRALAPFAPLERIPDVKSVSVEARSGWIAFTKGEGGNWWSEHVYVLTTEGCLQMRTLKGRKLYKVRWDQPCQL